MSARPREGPFAALDRLSDGEHGFKWQLWPEKRGAPRKSHREGVQLRAVTFLGELLSVPTEGANEAGAKGNMQNYLFQFPFGCSMGLWDTLDVCHTEAHLWTGN